MLQRNLLVKEPVVRILQFFDRVPTGDYRYITVTNGPMDKQRDSILEPFALSAAQLPNCVSNSLGCGPPVVGHIGPQLSAHRRKRHRTALVRR